MIVQDKIMINRSSHVPLYIQLQEELEHAISTSVYEDGAKLPSESQLCKEYGVSRITVRQALSGLEQKGLLYSVHGKGTYVSSSKIEQGLMKITSFEKTLEQKGMKGYTVIKSFSHKAIPAKVTQMFGADNVSHLCMVGYAEKMALVYYHSYLSDSVADSMYEMAKKMEAERKAFSTLDIFKQMTLSGLSIDQKMTAISSNKLIAGMLNVPLGVPVFKIETTAYNDEELLEYKEAYYRADKYAFTIKRHID